MEPGSAASQWAQLNQDQTQPEASPKKGKYNAEFI